MNSGATSERVYGALKRLVLDRAFRPGERLDPARLGDTLNSSVTPVRDALHILVGEGLVETGIGEGFHLPPMDEPGLQDLYGWNAQLLVLALRHWPPDQTSIGWSETCSTDAPFPDRTARLFEAIASPLANSDHKMAIARASDRLRPARLIEAARLRGLDEELAAIEGGLSQGDGPRLRQLITAYHRRRKRAAGDIVRALYRGD